MYFNLNKCCTKFCLKCLYSFKPLLFRTLVWNVWLECLSQEHLDSGNSVIRKGLSIYLEQKDNELHHITNLISTGLMGRTSSINTHIWIESQKETQLNKSAYHFCKLSCKIYRKFILNPALSIRL